MSVDPQLETYAYKSVLAELIEGFAGVHINTIGMRPQTNFEEWLDFYPLGNGRRRSRRAQWNGVVVFQVSCHSKIEELRDDRDTFACHALAERVRVLLEHKDLCVKQIGMAGESIIAVLNIKEARASYLPRRNISFEGDGNFSVEQGNTHTVVVSFQATLVAA